METEDRAPLRGFPWTLDDQERFALAHQIAEMRASGASGNDIRQRFGGQITGPVRRYLLREIGRGDLIHESYDRGAPGVNLQAVDGHIAYLRAQRNAAAARDVQALLDDYRRLVEG